MRAQRERVLPLLARSRILGTQRAAGEFLQKQGEAKKKKKSKKRKKKKAV